MIELKALHFFCGGECFYCGKPTWLENVERKADAIARLGFSSITNHRERRKALQRRRATREHLQRRADGGSNDYANTILSCQGCNSEREEKPVLVHLADMRNGSAVAAVLRAFPGAKVVKISGPVAQPEQSRERHVS